MIINKIKKNTSNKGQTKYNKYLNQNKTNCSNTKI